MAHRSGVAYILILILVCVVHDQGADEEHQLLTQEEPDRTGRGLADLKILVSGSERVVSKSEQLGEPPRS